MKNDVIQSMEELFQDSLRTGYITRGKLEENTLQSYYDADFDIPFSWQINYARAKYQANNSAGLPDGAQCPICIENAGSPGKENLKTMNVSLLSKDDFFIQLTPYPLFPRHFVLISQIHRPMDMAAQSLEEGLIFVNMAPDYTLCSNSDLPWAGASILSHSHYQLGYKLNLPVMAAAESHSYKAPVGMKIQKLNFPLPSIRISGKQMEDIIKCGGDIIREWKRTAPEKRTVNFILSKSNETYECILLLRDSDHRNPEDLQKYKSEGIGVIEAAGSWIFPPPRDFSEEEIRINSRIIIHGFFKGIRPFDPSDIKYFDFLPFDRMDNNE